MLVKGASEEESRQGGQQGPPAEDKSQAAAADPPQTMAAVARTCRALDPAPRLRAKIIHGFGRGSKMLGFPTANMEVRWDQEACQAALAPQERDILDFARGCEPGIYYAWGQVVDGKDNGVYKVAMSVGWNPTFTDVKAKTVEPWILHDYAEDFYGNELRLVVCGFVRPELKFDRFEDLVTAIREDGDYCGKALDEHCAVRDDAFFQEAAPSAL